MKLFYAFQTYKPWLVLKFINKLFVYRSCIGELQSQITLKLNNSNSGRNIWVKMPQWSNNCSEFEQTNQADENRLPTNDCPSNLNTAEWLSLQRCFSYRTNRLSNIILERIMFDNWGSMRFNMYMSKQDLVLDILEGQYSIKPNLWTNLIL